MDRRDFFKLSALTGAVTALESCGSPDNQLIRFIPDEDLIPGIATWKPSICTLCPAGCGLLVRVMQGEAEVMRDGKLGLIKMGLAKKLEGNPAHPVNAGKLCARGQAGLQVVYNPDRLRNPMKLSGARGSGQYVEISWDDAMKELLADQVKSASNGSSLAFLSRSAARTAARSGGEIPQGLRRAGAGRAYEPLADGVLRQANLMSFGHAALPTIDLGRADYVISFGADFLGTWNSPVAQGVGYGEMRQGRIGRRGKFAQVEPRMSQTGANADDWVPCNPGTEGVLALGIAQVILHDKLVSRDTKTRAGALIDGWAGGLADYTPDKVSMRTGVPAETITRLAHSLTQRGWATAAIVGGAPLAHTNGVFTALAVNALESLVDAGNGEPIVGFTPQSGGETGGQGSFAALTAFAQGVVSGQHAPKVLLLGEGNAVYGAPPKSQIREAIGKVPFVASFASFIDETSAMADLILPDHAPLESWLDDAPESGSTQVTVSVAPPALHPLFNTRAMPDVLLDLARQIGGAAAAALPAKTYDEMLQKAYLPLRKQRPNSPKTDSDDEFWSKVQDQGGWWVAPAAKSAAPAGGGSHPAAKFVEPQFDGAAAEYPYYFLPYDSQSFRDGSLAHLPWLQEMPDVVTTAMWSSWVELGAKAAEQMGIKTGDLVQVTSSQGSLQAPAIVSPGIAPDVVAMPIGQGHENFGRYATRRGANPLSILAPVTESETGSLAWAATRVRVTRAGGPEQAKLILYTGGGQSRFPHPEQEER